MLRVSVASGAYAAAIEAHRRQAHISAESCKSEQAAWATVGTASTTVCDVAGLAEAIAKEASLAPPPIPSTELEAASLAAMDRARPSDHAMPTEAELGAAGLRSASSKGSGLSYGGLSDEGSSPGRTVAHGGRRVLVALYGALGEASLCKWMAAAAPLAERGTARVVLRHFDRTAVASKLSPIGDISADVPLP